VPVGAVENVVYFGTDTHFHLHLESGGRHRAGATSQRAAAMRGPVGFPSGDAAQVLRTDGQRGEPPKERKRHGARAGFVSAALSSSFSRRPVRWVFWFTVRQGLMAVKWNSRRRWVRFMADIFDDTPALRTSDFLAAVGWRSDDDRQPLGSPGLF
jgi:hypothetical protein